jgi:RNA polymerase sigma-70 factor (ECF subfamily)
MSDSQQDFAALYLDYYPKIVGYLRRLVGDAEAEDVAQAAFVKISRSLEGFRGESRLSTWIYRIATNAAMDHIRRPSSKHTYRQVSDGADYDEGHGQTIVDSAPLHDTILIQKDMTACIRGMVNDLPEQYRTVLVLSDLEEFTNAEIGDVLGLSLDTVKIRLHRARSQLKKAMDHACHINHDGRNELSCDRKAATLVLTTR